MAARPDQWHLIRLCCFFWASLPGRRARVSSSVVAGGLCSVFELDGFDRAASRDDLLLVTQRITISRKDDPYGTIPKSYGKIALGLIGVSRALFHLSDDIVQVLGVKFLQLIDRFSYPRALPDRRH